MLYYAGIGSRKVSLDIQYKMTDLAMVLEILGFKLRTGKADGSDKAFMKGVKDKNNMETYDARSEISRKAFDIARKYHPTWNKLNDYSKRLIARTSHVILGKYLNEPVKFVVCWTPNGKNIGGTGQALRIAKAYNIKIYNLYFKKDYRDLMNLITCYKYKRDN